MGALGGGFEWSVGPNLTVYWTVDTVMNCPNIPGVLTDKFSGWYVSDAEGTPHPLPTSVFADEDQTGVSCVSGSGFTAQTIDGSGLTATVSADHRSSTVYTRNGLSSPTALSITDVYGNTVSFDSSNNTIKDSMGLQALTVTDPSVGPFSWRDVNGGSPQVSVAKSFFTLKTVFGCSGIGENNGGPLLPSSISFPDGTSLGLTYETTPGNSPDVTGRLNQITLRERGTVAYTYGGSNYGIDCTYSTTPVLTRTLGNGDITSYTLTHSLISGTAYKAVNTVIDPGGNKKIYQFTGFTSTGNAALPITQAVTDVKRYQGTTTLLTEDVYCYNKTFTSCSTSTAPTATVSLPVTELVAFHQINGMSTWSATDTKYDAYGNITYKADYDFGGTTPVRSVTTTFGSCSSGCTGSNPAISPIVNRHDRPGWVVVTQNGNTVADSRFSYDSNGSLLTTYQWTGSSYLSNTTANLYNSNGTPSKTYDLANNETDYTYAGGNYRQCDACTQYPFPTSIKNVATGLATSATYNGIGGVILTASDANGNGTINCYNTGAACNGGTADPYWRALQTIDPYGATVVKTYPTGSSPNAANTSFTFNSGNSISSTTVSTDVFGRPVNSQIAQSPAGSNFDTVSASHSWSGNYMQVSTSQPCSVGSGSSCTTVHNTDLDPLGRVYTVSTASNETVTHTYSQNDDLAVLTPAPANENVKQVQTQYDGLGRLTSSCTVSSTVSGAVSCGQNANPSFSGVLTTTSYTSASGSQTVSLTRGSQTRSTTVDARGRVIKKITPEGGTWIYTYDSNGSCPGGYRGASGQLASVSDPNGNLMCYAYDSMNRVSGVNANGTTCRHFYFDNSKGYSGSIPTGVSTPANSLGRMVEAATDSCSSGTLITDEWFSYDKDGRVSDMWELTPHSTQYYHSIATFADNGKVLTLQLANPSLVTVAYTLDGKGRWNTLKNATTGAQWVTGTSFNAVGLPTQVNLTGTDNDSYTYDPNTGLMTQFVFTVGSTPKSLTGNLHWNPNRTLGYIALTDGFNSGGTQTCYSNASSALGYGYDDLGRLVEFDCGSAGWGQQFSYDQYDNLAKSVISGRTGTTYSPGYSSTTNHCSICTYDADGNVTGDGNDVYGWNEFSKMKWTASSGTPSCGSSGMCITYDAFGRIVETSNGSTWTERWITQLGETAYMSGTSINLAYFPTDGLGIVGTQSSSFQAFYHHRDWVGNSRIESAIGGAVTTDKAYTPYGEMYAQFGYQGADTFAGIMGLFDPGVLYDAPNRELSIVGRWLSPDPVGSGWNQYAYPTNPNSNNDPSGLCATQGCTENCSATNSCFQPSPCDISNPCGPGSGNSGYGGPTGCLFNCNQIGQTSGNYTMTWGSNGGVWVNNGNGEALGSNDLQELGLALPPGLFDILNSFTPQTPVWGPCPGCQAGCAGAGIPCSLNRIGTGNLSSRIPGAQGSAFTYQIVDVNDNPVLGISLVDEYFYDSTGVLPPAGQEWKPGDDLDNGNVLPNGTFQDGVGMTPGMPGFSTSQAFSATVGGINYVISTSDSLSVRGFGNMVFVTRSP